MALFVNLEGCIELFPKVSTIDVSLFKYNETTRLSFFITHVLYVHVKLFSTFPFDALMYNRPFMIKLQSYLYFPSILVKWLNSLKIHGICSLAVQDRNVYYWDISTVTEKLVKIILWI